MRDPIRLLVVDDSTLTRKLIREFIQSDPAITIVGEADNGSQAVEMARALSPDVITMDVRMPLLSGIQATERIMAERPLPILVLSSFTTDGAPDTVAALAAGAVEAIPKFAPGMSMDAASIGRLLREKIRYWGRRPLPPLHKKMACAALAGGGQGGTPLPTTIDLVVIGVSTGGPTALPDMLKATGPLKCPIVIAQHMPSYFTKSYASSLSSQTNLPVIEGADGVAIEPSSVVVLPGSTDSTLERRTDGTLHLKCGLMDDEPTHPSVNLLFASALRVATNPAAVVLTGMGNDGSKGARSFADRRLPVLVQSPESCLVAGMPQSIIDLKAASHVMRVEEIGACLRNWCGER